MNVTIKDVWGTRVLITEDGSELKVDGQLAEYSGKVGRLHLIYDVSSHCGGHGMGDMYNSQVVLCTEDMQCIIMKDGTSSIKLFGY